MKVTAHPFRPLSIFRRLVPLAAAGLVGMPPGADAAISIGLQHFPGYGEGTPPPAVDTTDLVNTGSPALAFYNTTFLDPFQHTHDGTAFEATLTESEFPALTTFYLNTAANPLGYRIDSITVLTSSGDIDAAATAGLVGGARHHHYKIDYSLVGSADFETLTTIDIFVPEQPGYTRVTLLDLGLETVGVDVIRMTWLDPLPAINSYVLLSEVDIGGAAITQVPEPGSGLLALGAGALLLLRRARGKC